MSRTSPILSRRAFLGTQALAVASVLAGCSAPAEDGQDAPNAIRSLEEIRASGYLRIGVNSDNCPLAFINYSGSYDGLEHYFGLYAASRVGVAPQFVAIDPPGRYDALLDGVVDVALTQMSESDERAGEVTLSDPYYTLRLGVISPSESPIASADELLAGELVVCEGGYAQQFARETWPDVPLRAYGSVSDSYAALAAGHGAALLGDELCLAAWAKEHQGFTLGMKAVSEARAIAPAVVPGREDFESKLQDAVAGFINRGYRARCYSSDIQSRLGNSYSDMFEGI